MPETVQTKRVVTFVPAGQAEELASAIAADIPYLFGDYDSVCWWSAPKTEPGTEQFRPLKGDLEHTPSIRMEFSIPDDPQVIERFTQRLRDHHPWQQPVILLFTADILK